MMVKIVVASSEFVALLPCSVGPSGNTYRVLVCKSLVSYVIRILYVCDAKDSSRRILNLGGRSQFTIIGLPLNFLRALHIPLYRIITSPKAFKSSVSASSSESNTTIIMTILFLAAAHAIAHFAHGIMNIPTMNEKIELVESQAERLQFMVHRLESDSTNNRPFQLE
jgi:hypothetical protein